MYVYIMYKLHACESACDVSSRMVLIFRSSKWEPNPNTPFQPPKHLKEIIDDFEMHEAPSIGLAPRPSAPSAGGSPPTVNHATKGPSAEKDEDIDFFVS